MQSPLRPSQRAPDARRASARDEDRVGHEQLPHLEVRQLPGELRSQADIRPRTHLSALRRHTAPHGVPAGRGLRHPLHRTCCARGNMILADYLEPLAYDIAFWTIGLYDDAAPVEGLGALSGELTNKLGTAAIISLLAKADVDGYCHNLIRAARARERYLARIHELRAWDDHDFCAGRLAGFFAACAAEDFTRARNIATLSAG